MRWRCLQKFDPETGRHRPRCREPLLDSPDPPPNLAAPARQERPPPRRPYPELLPAGGFPTVRVLHELLLEGADSAPASDIFCAKRSIGSPFAPRALRLMRMAEGRAGDPEAGPAPRGRSAAGRPQEVPRLPGATARVPGESTHLVAEVLPERQRHPCPCWEECVATRAWGYLFCFLRGEALRSLNWAFS